MLGYAKKIYNIDNMLEQVRDNRLKPRIKTESIVKANLVMCITRMGSLHAAGQTKGHPFWKKWIKDKFPSISTSGRIFEGIYAEDLRAMLKHIYTRRKRNKSLKAFSRSMCILVLDGHESSASYLRRCRQCLRRTVHTKAGDKIQYYHRLVAATLLCGNTSVLIDCEMQRPGEDEVAAATRLFTRVQEDYPRAFQMVGADGLYLRPEFFHLVRAAGKEAMAVLKNENRDLIKDARSVFEQIEPLVFQEGNTTYQCWDTDGFKTWPQFKGPVRIVRTIETTRVRQQISKKIKEETVEWMWATTIPALRLPTKDAIRVGHGRWAIENEGGFNELVNTWHADHVYKHHINAILTFWLLTMVAFNLFHAFLKLNIKLALRLRHTAKHFRELITADFYAGMFIAAHPP